MASSYGVEFEGISFVLHATQTWAHMVICDPEKVVFRR